jgi:long-chain acyl-CoA synthetase
LVRAADASPMKRRIFEYFRRVADRAEQCKADGKTVPPHIALARMLGEIFVYGPIRDQLGWRRARVVYTGGAPLGADVFKFFRAIGINLKQVYGATELSGLCSVQPDAEVDPDTVGRILDGMEARIAEGGEVEVRSAGIFKGYYKQPEVTQEVLTEDGWLKTGDAGFVDRRGHLAIIDRAKDVGRLDDGTSFAPQYLENKLKFSPYVGEAVVFGDGKPFVAAIVAIDPNTVGKWAERNSLAYTSFQDLCARPEVLGLVRAEIRKCNALLPPAARIHRFLVLNKEFDADDDEITRTRKIRRGFVAKKYAAVIEGFYSGAGEVELNTEITYEDGRKAMLQSVLAIGDVEGGERLTPGQARPRSEPALAAGE